MAPAENTLLQLVREQVVAQFGEAWFLRQWAWPNPDANHLRLKLPPYVEPGGWPRQQVDLRIRPAAERLAEATLPGHLRPAVAHVGCWSFDGAEQVALTDFWILVLENAGPTQSPTYVVLPTLVLLGYLRSSADAGRLYLYFTHQGECYASPSLRTKLSALVTYGPRTSTSCVCLTLYLNAWYQLAGDGCS